MKNLGISYERLDIIEPLGYLEFNYLEECSKALITVSGGITEETTIMIIPCMIFRHNTECPETAETGRNEILGVNPKAKQPLLEKFFQANGSRMKFQ